MLFKVILIKVINLIYNFILIRFSLKIILLIYIYYSFFFKNIKEYLKKNIYNYYFILYKYYLIESNIIIYIIYRALFY